MNEEFKSEDSEDKGPSQYDWELMAIDGMIIQNIQMMTVELLDLQSRVKFLEEMILNG